MSIPHQAHLRVVSWIPATSAGMTKNCASSGQAKVEVIPGLVPGIQRATISATGFAARNAHLLHVYSRQQTSRNALHRGHQWPHSQSASTQDRNSVQLHAEVSRTQTRLVRGLLVCQRGDSA